MSLRRRGGTASAMDSSAQNRAVAGDNGIHESSLRCIACSFVARGP